MPPATTSDIQHMTVCRDMSDMLNNPVQRGQILVRGGTVTHKDNWRKINLNVAILGKMTKLGMYSYFALETSSHDFI